MPCPICCGSGRTSRSSAPSSPWRCSQEKIREHRHPRHGHRGRSRTPSGSRIGHFDLEFVAVNHSIPDALAVAVRTTAGMRAAHRRLQDGPAAAGRADHRPARRSPGSARRASTCSWSTRPTPRCRASPRPSATSPRPWTGSSPPASSASSWPASPRTCTGCSRCWTPPSPTVARSSTSGARWCATWASRATSAILHVPADTLIELRDIDNYRPRGRRHHLHRIAGRAAVGALPDGQPRAPGDPARARATPWCWRAR